MKFSPLNVDFSSPSLDPLNLRRPAHAVSKRGTTLKSGYLSAVGLSSVKMVADTCRHVAQAGCLSQQALATMTLNPKNIG